jgi:hypothetical protein
MSREHHSTPTLAGTIGSDDVAGLACFGRVLEVHTRYEEREPFPVAAAILPAAAFAEVVTYASVVIEPVT